jgi:magnesium chelatase family protein
MRARVVAARDRQRHRLKKFGLNCNAEMSSTIMRKTCRLDSSCERVLAQLVAARRSFTARSVDRLIKVARTIADLDGVDTITHHHLNEAASYRDPDPIAHHLTAA